MIIACCNSRSKPSSCSSAVYTDFLLPCFALKPEKRPPFVSLAQRLHEVLFVMGSSTRRSSSEETDSRRPSHLTTSLVEPIREPEGTSMGRPVAALLDKGEPILELTPGPNGVLQQSTVYLRPDDASSAEHSAVSRPGAETGPRVHASPPTSSGAPPADVSLMLTESEI